MKTAHDHWSLPYSAARTGEGGPKHILVVDESPSLCRMMATILRRAGHCVEAVPDGDAAVEALSTRDYDLLVTDHLLPEFSGLALVGWVRVGDLARYSVGAAKVPQSWEAARSSTDRGVPIDGFVDKPFTALQLQEAVHRVLLVTPSRHGGAGISSTLGWPVRSSSYAGCAEQTATLELNEYDG